MYLTAGNLDIYFIPAAHTLTSTLKGNDMKQSTIFLLASILFNILVLVSALQCAGLPLMVLLSGLGLAFLGFSFHSLARDL